MSKFLDNIIAERIRLIREDKNPIHIYELLEKNLNLSIEEIKKKLEITLDINKSRVFITGDTGSVYYIFNFLSSRGVEFESVDLSKLRIDLDVFLRKIF